MWVITVVDIVFLRSIWPSLAWWWLVLLHKHCLCYALVPVHFCKVDCVFFAFCYLIADVDAFSVQDFVQVFHDISPVVGAWVSPFVVSIIYRQAVLGQLNVSI